MELLISRPAFGKVLVEIVRLKTPSRLLRMRWNGASSSPLSPDIARRVCVTQKLLIAHV